jgi:predicted O-linked N-acetylglucosamine transferase (SPINDLY family)
VEKTPAAFVNAIAGIDAQNIGLTELISAADGLATSGESTLSLVLYKYWLLSNASNPLRHVPAFNCGSTLLGRGNLAEAKKYLAIAVEASPHFFPARLNFALALERSGDAQAAIVQFEQVASGLNGATPPDTATRVFALKNLARIQRHTAPGMAEQALQQAVEADPTQLELIQHWAHTRQERCIWPVLTSVGQLSGAQVLHTMTPLSMSAYCDDPWLQLATAWRYTNERVRSGAICTTLGSWPSSEDAGKAKLRIGYLSSDFCSHAIGYLISDIFQFHNKERFEITVFNIGEHRSDPIQQKIASGVDAWVDVCDLSDKDAALAILAKEIDILLDINGHTNYQRPRMLAMKPAPIIASWLGYPGTMGSDAHQYIIADDFIVPPAFEKYYSEKVLRLPCYQPNGHLFEVPTQTKSRQELGLPESGFVFCCFNGAIKITPAVFARWMHILRHVANSVLWLRGAGVDTETRLRDLAEAQGIQGSRLVFLPFCSNTEYLGYHRNADLFLDTFPYGAHTTASDALRMGIPIVTLAGLSFAARVCGSLSKAAGLPDLVCSTPEQYVAIAIELGNDGAKLAAVQKKLRDSLPHCVLFNAEKLVRHLEALCESMWAAHRSGWVHTPEQPDLASVFAASGTRNLSTISEFLSPQDYEPLYHPTMPSAASHSEGALA